MTASAPIGVPGPAAPAGSSARPTRRDIGWMTAGTVLIGLSGYVFLALVGHGRFSAPAAAALSSMYLLANILGPGLFVAVEQETSRQVSQRRARGSPFGAVAAQTAIAAAGIAALTMVALLIFGGPVTSGVLRGETGLLLALGLSVVGSAAVFWVRGLAGGQRRFPSYGSTLVVDAGVRILGCGVLALLGVTEPIGYGLALCSGPLIAAVVTVRPVLPSAARTKVVAAQPQSVAAGAGWTALIRAIAALLVSSGISMAIANLAPVLVNAALPGDPALAFSFAGALVLTRVPLLLMGPVQALVLPRLTTAVTRRRMADFRRQLGRCLLLVAAVAVAAIAGAWLLGRWVMRMVYGRAADLLPGSTLALLAGAAGLLMAISLLQPALVALGQHTGMVLGWLLGAVIFGCAFLLPLAPVNQALVAQLAGPLTAVAVHFGVLRAAMGQFNAERSARASTMDP